MLRGDDAERTRCRVTYWKYAFILTMEKLRRCLEGQ